MGEFFEWVGNTVGAAVDVVTDFFTTDDGGIDMSKVAPILGLFLASRAKDSSTISDFLGLGGDSSGPLGYMGGIPDYTAYRQQVPMYTQADAAAYDPDRRPGGGGRRYFTQTQYVGTGGDAAANQAAIDAAQAATDEEKWNLATQNLTNLSRETTPTSTKYPATATSTGIVPAQRTYMAPASSADVVQGRLDQLISAAQPGAIGMMGGGLASLKGIGQGYYLGGPTDGMADRIPATIDATQPAALSDGEFVIPADVVSHLGNGNSNAGAEQLYSMMDRVRQARTGRQTQGTQINPNKFMPS
jgi:hypothetical protein